MENFDWKYIPVECTNLVHYRNRIYVPKNLHKRVLKWYHYYLQHPSGDTLAQILTTNCVWSIILVLLSLNITLQTLQKIFCNSITKGNQTKYIPYPITMASVRQTVNFLSGTLVILVITSGLFCISV